MVRIVALMAAGSLLALGGAHSPAGARASGPGGEFAPWNPSHLTSLPQDVQGHIARLCGGTVRAGHDFARYLNEDGRHFVILHFEHLRCDDMLLYSSDFPHWQFDGDDPMPAGIPAALRRKILVENPIATYDRLKGDRPEEAAR